MDSLSKILVPKVCVLLVHGRTRFTISQCAVSSSSPPYIGLCCTWLLKNLHNPYPSPEIRKKMSMESNSSPRHVESWFIDARKRIGWNDIRKKYFAKRADMIK